MLQKSTRPANPGDNRKWFLVDAKDQVLGRLAVVIANKHPRRAAKGPPPA